MMTKPTAEQKAHPAYSDGYWNGLEDEPRLDGKPDEYYLGYEAGRRAAEIFTSAGMQKTGEGEFSIALTLDPRETSEDE